MAKTIILHLTPQGAQQAISDAIASGNTDYVNQATAGIQKATAALQAANAAAQAAMSQKVGVSNPMASSGGGTTSATSSTTAPSATPGKYLPAGGAAAGAAAGFAVGGPIGAAIGLVAGYFGGKAVQTHEVNAQAAANQSQTISTQTTPAVSGEWDKTAKWSPRGRWSPQGKWSAHGDEGIR